MALERLHKVLANAGAATRRRRWPGPCGAVRGPSREVEEQTSDWGRWTWDFVPGHSLSALSIEFSRLGDLTRRGILAGEQVIAREEREGRSERERRPGRARRMNLLSLPPFAPAWSCS